MEPRGELLSPAYWGGVDIENPNHFAFPPTPITLHTRREHRLAATSLKLCLSRVLRGNYTETSSLLRPEFEPDQQQLADGTVIAIDSEQLRKWTLIDSGVKAVGGPSFPNDSPRIRTPFAEYWRENQTVEDLVNLRHFAQEDAIFHEESAMYSRTVDWGVLLSRRDGTRIAVTFPLAVPRASTVGILIPSRSSIADGLPIDIGLAEPVPPSQLDPRATRRIQRVKDIRVVRPAGGSREKAPSMTEKLKIAAEKLGRTAVPKLKPVFS